MESVWFRSELADEILKDDLIFNEINNVVTDIICGKLEITRIIENMAKILTHKEAENRAKGMKFFTIILKELPKNYLTEMQLKYICKFYIDRLKDNHRVIPCVLEGYLCLVEMENYEVQNCGEFLTVMFQEVPCQSQVRQDRYNIYKLIETLLDKDAECLKALGPDLVYGVITSMDGERDPRNLMFLFSFLPKFLSRIPIGHLVDEMFEVISCYYPIDFHASPDDPAAVTRDDLAMKLGPCLCAIPQFGENCLILLIEKLDSSLRLAKIDSLRLLTRSFKTFNADTYVPFLKAIWSSVQREISHKTDDELKMAAYEALSALTKKLSTSANTDQTFENFVKGILISMQTLMAESTTTAQFVQSSKVLLTVANSSKESCEIVLRVMIPSSITYYGFSNSPKLQIVCLDFLGDLADLAQHWELTNEVGQLLNEIPQLCLTAVSNHGKEYQIAGFKTLIRVKDFLSTDLVLPFVEVLILNIQHAQDGDLMAKSVETVHELGRKFPELIMDLVVKGKCDLNNLTQDKSAMTKRLDLLCNLASIDDFTKVIIEEMLKIISVTGKDDAQKVVTAMCTSISNSNLYSKQKVAQIESDHGLTDSVLNWLLTELSETVSYELLEHGYLLISNTVASLAEDKQRKLLAAHTDMLLNYTKKREVYFLVLEALYNSLQQSLFEDRFREIMTLSLRLCLESELRLVRKKAGVLVAHFLNKAEYGEKFDSLYVVLKDNLSSCSRDEEGLCSNLISLYGWLTKGLIMRGSDLFLFWLKKITIALSTPEWCNDGAEAIRLVMSESQEYLNHKCHCRTSLLYKQRMFQTFMSLTEKFEASNSDIKQAYLLSWAHILREVSKTVLINEAEKLSPLVVESLGCDDSELLSVMTDVLSHLVRSKYRSPANSLQTILPRLVKLSKHLNSMDVRIKSLECLYEIANSYSTALLLPHKQDVLYDLAPSLDDKKRLVRNMAVRARTRWFLVGSPGEGGN